MCGAWLRCIGWLLLGLSGANVAHCADRTLTRADLESWLDGYMPYALKSGDVAGAEVVVVKEGEVLLEKGYGYADVARREPVDPQRTLFRPGSISKLFTWTAVMQLVEAGKLDLDRDINTYLDFRIPAYEGRPITLRNIMTHTAGFEETVKEAATYDPSRVQPLDVYLKTHLPRRIYPPGEIPAYSNYATSLAGYVVQRVSGEMFADYIDRHIFAPLGMRHSSFHQPLPAGWPAQLAKGYRVASEPPGPYEIFATAPAGNLVATGDDMARFMIAHLNGGAYGENRILKEQTAAQMHGTALTILPAVNRMLLGFYERHRNGHRIIGHGGDTQLFHSYLYLFLDQKVGLYVGLNSTGSDWASSNIRTALFEEFTDRYFPGPTPDGKLDAATVTRDAARMAGVYELSRRSATNFLSIGEFLSPTFVTVNEDGTLSVSMLTDFSNQPKSWREIAPLVWRDVQGKDLLSARVVNDRVAMFSADEFSPYMVLKPPPWWRSPAWLLPAVKLSLLLVSVELLLWPIGALARRYYRASRQPTAEDGRRMRLACIAMLVPVAGWMGTFVLMVASHMPFTSRADPWFWSLSLLGAVCFVGAAGLAVTNAWRVLCGSRGRLASVWNCLLAGASLALLWAAYCQNLLGMNMNY